MFFYVNLPVVYHIVCIYGRYTNLEPHNDDLKKHNFPVQIDVKTEG